MFTKKAPMLALALLCLAPLAHATAAESGASAPPRLTASSPEVFAGLTLPENLKCRAGRKNDTDVWQRLGSTVVAARTDGKNGAALQKELDESLQLYISSGECTTAPTSDRSFVTLRNAPRYSVTE